MTDDRRQRTISLLERLYARVPALDCQGKCAHSCVSGIDMSDAERARIRAAGKDIPERHNAQPGGRCPVLTFLGTCSVYSIRPMVCRVWGTTESMPCPHGCRPEGNHLLSEETMLELLLISLEIGGSSLVDQISHLRQFLRDSYVAQLVARIIRGDAIAQATLMTVLVERHLS